MKNIAIFYESRRSHFEVVTSFLKTIVLKDVGDEDEICLISVFTGKEMELALYKLIKGKDKWSYMIYKRRRNRSMEAYIKEMIEKEHITDAVFFSFTKELPRKFRIGIETFYTSGIAPILLTTELSPQKDAP